MSEPSAGATKAASAIRLAERSDPAFNTTDIARIIDRETGVKELMEAAQALLKRIDNITTLDFSRGGEKTERENLRAILEKYGKE
jgi:glycosyltransferase involved in cell wall biosynthesis